MMSPWNMLLLLTLVTAEAQPTYKYFNFVRQWSPNACYTSPHACKHFPTNINTWTIHGLWPSLNATHYPSDCDGEFCNFNSTLIADLAPRLHDEWPSDYKGGDTKFWAHEYCKHGTCCTDLLSTERDFFEKVLCLHAKLDMGAALKRAHVVPDVNKPYGMDQLTDAIREGFNVERATLWCRFVKDGEGETKQLLYQVSICIDKEFKPISCPEQARHSCDEAKAFYLLPFSVLSATEG